MQDELTKHTKKIYNTLISSKNKVTEKVKEVTIEIFIIVFSVTLSIWLHSCSVSRHQKKETIEFLVDLKEDLNKDIESMTDEKDKLSKAVKHYKYLYDFTEKQIDSITAANAQISMNIRYVIRKTNNGNYEGFKSSGKIGFIENKKLKKLILQYYQESMPSMEENEKYYNSRLNRIEELMYQNREKNRIFIDLVVKTSFSIILQSASGNLIGYDEIIKDAKDIKSEIDKEIKE